MAQPARVRNCRTLKNDRGEEDPEASPISPLLCEYPSPISFTAHQNPIMQDTVALDNVVLRDIEKG